MKTDPPSVTYYLQWCLPEDQLALQYMLTWTVTTHKPTLRVCGFDWKMHSTRYPHDWCTRWNLDPTKAWGFPSFQDSHLHWHNQRNKTGPVGAVRPPWSKCHSVQVSGIIIKPIKRTYRLIELLVQISQDYCSMSSQPDIPSPGCMHKLWMYCSPAKKKRRARSTHQQHSRHSYTSSSSWSGLTESAFLFSCFCESLHSSHCCIQCLFCKILSTKHGYVHAALSELSN